MGVTRRTDPISLTLRGWGNPAPLAIQIADVRDIARLRAGIRADLAKLLPRCEALERTLPEEALQHRGYVGSKTRPEFALKIVKADRHAGLPGRPVDPASAIRLKAVDVSGTTLHDLLRPPRRILCVGEPTDAVLRDALCDLSSLTTTVMPGDGEAVLVPSGRKRPGSNSFGAWQAAQDETDRAEIGSIVLGRQAGRDDVELLRHRVYAHQRVFVEAGSAALTWLLSAWGGVANRHGNVFVLSEPADHFREPSGRVRLAPHVEWPRITVVTVSYNQCRYLEQCLLSVLDQDYPNLEYIVVDAGSSDGSVELLRRYEHRFAKLIVESDQGQSDGLNKGFRFATGDILTWVNSDDMLAPLSLKRAAMVMCATGADLIAGTCKRIEGEGGRVLYRHHAALQTSRMEPFALHGPLDWCNGWEKADYFFQPEVFFTRSIWNRAGGYLKLQLFWAMDWDFWLRCALAGANIVRIPDTLGISRVHAEQKTTSAEMYLWQIVGILRDYDDLLAAVATEIGAG
jgi:GT2 family glycosyltransferase